MTKSAAGLGVHAFGETEGAPPALDQQERAQASGMVDPVAETALEKSGFGDTDSEPS